jgi:glycolate oxidase
MTVLDELAAGLPAEALITDSTSTDAYRFDEASFCAAGAPLAVVRPTETASCSR